MKRRQLTNFLVHNESLKRTSADSLRKMNSVKLNSNYMREFYNVRNTPILLQKPMNELFEECTTLKKDEVDDDIFDKYCNKHPLIPKRDFNIDD
jgi:hypothetical protein